jgi:cysteine-rich repeat protein
MRASLGWFWVLTACATESKSPDRQPDNPGTEVVVDSADSGAAVDSGEPWVSPGCGDGRLDAGELCDDGAANSDTTPDACRTTCVPAACGDGVQDSDETCDDGNTVSADGCSSVCLEEAGLLEVEPNDSWDGAQVLGEERLVVGALPEDDTDCFQVEVSACEALAARVDADCGSSLLLNLHGPDGSVTASGSATADACAELHPDDATGARFLEEGSWAVCLTSPTEAPVAGYSMSVEVLDVESLSYELPDGEDPDNDGVPDRCDNDDDGDGILDVDDDCPDVPDGDGAPPFSVSTNGFIRTWLAAGPFTGTTSTDRCRPSDDTLVHATDDALAEPVLAGAAGSLIWTTLLSPSDRVDFLGDYGGVGAPREVYTAVWVRGTAGDATLALGPDDGVRAWFDGAEVLDISGCQGTNVDQFQADVTFSGDWQLLLVKVRDQGGGWGNYARFLDTSGAPITGVEVALTADGSPLPTVDTDGDGLGDACDDTPAG